MRTRNGHEVGRAETDIAERLTGGMGRWPEAFADRWDVALRDCIYLHAELERTRRELAATREALEYERERADGMARLAGLDKRVSRYL